MSERHITYRREIKVSRGDLEAARAGRKMCTIRLGTAAVASKHIDLTDGSSRLKVEVTRTDTSKKFGQMGMEEAQGEGFSSIAELRSDLMRYYRDLDDEKAVTVIWFVPADSPSART